VRGEVIAGTDQAGRQIIVASGVAILIALVLAFYLSRDMRHVTGDIQEGANGLSSASSEILAAVAQQSSGATEQSAAIAQTAATVAQVKASADEAVQMAMVVSDTAREASRVAGEGVHAARAAADGMADLREKVESIAENILALSEQSQRIGDIIATVNDLADQSNLLALNAAIEASRAGEQGKGFAVVATEIRNLAEQSKAATAQVRTILGDIQRATNATVLSTEQGTRGVDTGMALVQQTGQTIGELANVIDQASDSAHRIAASVRQHSVGMEQVAAAMVNINQATTHNLSATADTRKAAEHLTTLAGGLTRTVAQYKV
jgi:methyl-accepting chemotaxis protein